MINNFKSYLESIKITPISWLIGISGVLLVRFFLESLSSQTSSGFFASDASTLLHYYLFFVASFLIFLIIFEKLVPNWKNVAPQFVVVSSAIIFVAPIIDWILGRGQKITMTYLLDSPKEMLHSLLTFFGPNIYAGITIGMRIEVALAILGLGFFVYFLRKSLKWAVFSAFVIYLLAFVFVSLPSFLNLIFGQIANTNYFNQPLFFIQNSIENSATILNNIHSSLQYSSTVRLFEIAFNFLMGKILFLILIGSVFVWFRSNFKEKFNAIIKNSRPERVMHYLLMIFLGLFAAYTIFPNVSFNWNDSLSLLVLCLSFYFSWMFAVCTNDIVDEEIDAISDPARPLIANSLNKEDMKEASYLFLAATIISGFLAGYTALFFVLAFTALYYIYSVPPTRYKIIPFFSSFIIGLCCLTAVLAGFFLLSPLKYVAIFPPQLALAVVVIFSLLANVRDMKDIEGDKKVGIKTVPIIFGDVWGPKVVGIFAGLAFILVPIFSSIYILFITAIPAALASFYYINKKPYSEKPIFVIYIFFILVSILLLVV